MNYQFFIVETGFTKDVTVAPVIKVLEPDLSTRQAKDLWWKEFAYIGDLVRYDLKDDSEIVNPRIVRFRKYHGNKPKKAVLVSAT